MDYPAYLQLKAPRHLPKVGYLGPGTASFGHGAVCRFFPNTQTLRVPLERHDKICQAVAQGDLDLGVIAVENGIAGMVDESLHAIGLGVQKTHG